MILDRFFSEILKISKLFLRIPQIAPFVMLVIVVSCKGEEPAKEKGPWDMMQEVVESVKEPTFPDKTFNVVDYGAKADGVTKNTDAFKKAIKACAESGGGKVVVPKGEYLTGAIHLEDNVNLHLEEGAEILFK